MPSEPTVCAILLTRDRPEMAARAVRAFRAQTYERASIIALDTGSGDNLDIQYCHMPNWAGRPIGALRNEANSLAMSADILVNWDSDDWSHPNRIAEQVDLLQRTGAECVGYNRMLFWKTGLRAELKDIPSGRYLQATSASEAWLYSGPAHEPLGTSLCYWRRSWMRVGGFDPTLNTGEDTEFCRRLGFRNVASAAGFSVQPDSLNDRIDNEVPMLIATIHGGNTTSRVHPGAKEWQRAAEWDGAVRQLLEEA